MSDFRFYDNREKYLLFVTTTNEKAMIARRVGQELERLKPTPPAMRVFDAGMGDATVLNTLLEEMHWRFPTIPFVVVAKEVSMEDTRLGLFKLHGRFAEHPETVVVMTNMYYSEAPWLRPRDQRLDDLLWWDVPLDGTTAHEFGVQLRDLDAVISEGWQTETSASGNLRYKRPAVVVLYRRDHAFALEHVVPTRERFGGNYDLVLAAQPYRSRTPAEFKVEKVLAPLASSLAPHGRMVVVQSTGHDPGMELIRRIWPEEDPFVTPRHVVVQALDDALNADGERYEFEGLGDDESLFTYSMHSLPEHVDAGIGTSQLLAAWNAAVYVAQIDADRVNDVLQSGAFVDASREVLARHGGLWFQDESFVVKPAVD